MLMESEQSIAREDSDGSETVMGFMALVSCLFGECNLTVQESEKQTFSIVAKGAVS
jgi:hypothetical protein